MSICKTCQDQTCQKTGTPCKKVEEILRKEKIYSRDYIRPRVSPLKEKDGMGKWREIPMSALNTKGRKQAKISKKWGNQE